MARTLYRLSDKIIRNVDAPGYHADGGGLYLQVTKAGGKSFVFRFTLKGRTRDMGLGPLRSVTLADARAKAADYRALTAKGIDPIEHAKAEAIEEPDEPATETGPTFRDYAEECIRGWQDDWKSDKHAAQWSATLAAFAYPIIGHMPIAAIETKDILAVLKPIWREKSETAARVRGRIERVLAAASVEGLRQGNPAVWKGHLKEAKGLGKKRKSIPFAALPYVEMPSFMDALRRREGVGAVCLEFTILTAARSGEARGARWIEIDEAARTWTVPAVRMKGGRDHVVPLSDRAMEILAAMKPLRDLAGGFVFPGAKGGRPLSDMTLTAVMHAMGYEQTVHGFRSAFRDWAGDTTHFHRDVAEAALAHAIRDKTEAAYRRGTAIEKRRELMAAWAAYISLAPVENVVPLGVAAA